MILTDLERNSLAQLAAEKKHDGDKPEGPAAKKAAPTDAKRN
jgi:hypothetical protein